MSKSIVIRQTAPDDPNVVMLIDELDRYQSSLYPAESNHLDSIEELTKNNVYFVCAYFNEQIIGCGAVKKYHCSDSYGEIKRMYVIPVYRGQGISVELLDALEEHLREDRIYCARLETGIHQSEALGLYYKQGYTKCGPFGSYTPDLMSVFMEKDLSK